MLKKYSFIFILLLVIIIFALYTRTFTKSTTTPENHSLNVPFTTQAPFNQWEGNENCEEASLVMAWSYFSGNQGGIVSPAEAAQKITELQDWENIHFGQNKDTGSMYTERMAKEVLGLNTKVLENFTAEDIKKELSDGHIVILPLDARGLAHPNYKRGAVDYHMIVIRGFNSQGFVIHDPGTEAGRDNVYAFSNLYGSAADWDNQKNQLNPTHKALLVVWK